MVGNKEIYEELNRILNSETFKKATTTNVLLKHLVESTIQKKEINAYTIGIELFGNKYNPEKSDVNIRVNISHLRKRLKQYYEREGEKNPIIVTIEPGQYLASFKERKQLKEKGTKKGLIPVSGVIILLIVSFLIFRGKPDNVWKPLLENKYETTLYLGDVFGYTGTNVFGRKGWHRDSKINSAEEFYEMLKTEPKNYSDLAPGNFSYVVFENAFNIKPFTQYFTKNNYDFLIRQTTDFKIRTIKERNTIYAGPAFSQKVFNELFNNFSNNARFHFNKKTKPAFTLSYVNENMENEVINLYSKFEDGEYALAAGFNGPNNTKHYMFISNHGMGLTAIIEYFTKKESLKSFSNKYLKKSDEFIALFFVKGKDRTSMDINLVYFSDNKKF